MTNHLSEQDIIEIDGQLEATRRAILKGSVAGLAVAGTMALTGCGEAKEEQEEESKSLATNVTGEESEGGHGITTADIEAAERVAGTAYTPAERQQIVNVIDGQIDSQLAVRALGLPNALHTAHVFDPRLPGRDYGIRGNQDNSVAVSETPGALPSSDEDIAFAPLTHLSHWVRTKQISSRELTELYLGRIAKYAPGLECFVTVTDDLARGQAAKADAEIAAGNYRGPLHGIPYAMKDLMDTANIRTSWGAMPYKDRVAESDGTLVVKLKDAGAVLVGKTTLGALAYGDVWFGGKTRNPWNTEEGSSGSSAGSASSTAAGLVGFAIGTETLGSIVSPSTRCGATGLRPTFGRVSRAGAMALCWSLDKFGPICRSVEDTALVLAAIKGSDVADPSSIEMGFAYDGAQAASDLRVGYVPAFFEENANDVDRAALAAARSAGLNLVEVGLPDMPYGALVQQLLAEAAAAFEELTLSNRDDEMVWQGDAAWPNSFRAARFLSAVDLINIDRFRRQVMGVMDDLFSGIDAMIGPSFGGSMLTITNFTGQPQLAIRAGFIDSPTRDRNGPPAGEDAPTHRVPHSFGVWAPLFGEANALTVGKALEAELGVRDERPVLAG